MGCEAGRGKQEEDSGQPEGCNSLPSNLSQPLPGLPDLSSTSERSLLN